MRKRAKTALFNTRGGSNRTRNSRKSADRRGIIFMSKKQLFPILFCLVFCFGALGTAAQQQAKKTANDSDDYFKPVKWRSIGPFRGGRSVAAHGVIGDPKTYYMGTTGGGLWKTDDMGVSVAEYFRRIFQDRFGRRDRGCAERSECRLCRNGRTCGSRRDDAFTATAFINRPMPERPGKRSAWTRRSTSRESSLIRKIPTWFTLRRRALCSASSPERGVYKSTRRRQDVEKRALC